MRGKAEPRDVVRSFVRPDGRRFVRVDAISANDVEPDGDLYASIDESDDDARRRCDQLGFVINRRESVLLLPTDPELTGLSGVERPSGFRFEAADRVDLDRLRVLDNALRQDVPGTDGWKWDAVAFREETFSAGFDPRTYLVAVEEATGDYLGIVRVWNNPERPRLGLIAVLPDYRRRGLARALLAQVFAVLHDRRRPEVVTEVDDANVASRALLEGVGSRRIGGSLELVKREPSNRLLQGSGLD